MKNDKMYVVRKYVKATSVAEALKKERKTEIHEIFVDEQWQKNNLAAAIGFAVEKREED